MAINDKPYRRLFREVMNLGNQNPFLSAQRKILLNTPQQTDAIKPMISITFDDGSITHYTVAFPILKANGMRGTFFIIGDLVNSQYAMTETQIKEMANHGQEIACHSWSHVHLTQIPNDEDIVKQWTDNKTYLENLIGKPVLTHAIPYGDTNLRVRQLSKGVFESVRRTGSVGQSVKFGDDNTHHYPGSFIDGLSVSEVKNIIDSHMNKPEPEWLILGLHRLTTTTPHDDFLSETDFAEIIEYINDNYAKNNLVHVVPFYEGARRIQSHISANL